MTYDVNQGSDPIAIVGIGCRLPGGVTDPDSLWRLLTDGVDAVGPVPPERWDVERYYSPRPQQPGRMNAREAGFLDDPEGFDAAFFNVSGRVAEQMDPQQRMLLEVCWETLEDAGMVPGELAQTNTGVYMGACSQDYGTLQSSPTEVDVLGPHSATGFFNSILSNRVSYMFDLRGPSMTIDTACSSSLVAVHLACDSLRRNDAELALAGGVNVMLTPQYGIALSQAGMLSPDARSRAFDADANGYVRGEGAGVVALKPLEAAQRDGDRIYGVVRGTATNQDGRTQGITVPNGDSQSANFRAALDDAGVAASDLGYIEAHGTGTPVGDPIEANALGRVLATSAASDRTTYLGSIKTNLGHLEAGAGIAGLIKATLAVYHRQVPPSLHYRRPHPDIDLAGLGLAVPTSTQPWPEDRKLAVASVNSFGFGGANANVVLSSGPPAPHNTLDTASEPTRATPPTVVTLSARSEQALQRAAESHADQLENQDVALDKVAAYLALRRSHHPHRLTVAARSAREAADKLRAYGAGQHDRDVCTGHAPPGRRKVAFLLNGQGPQWHAMGRRLLETSPVFRATIDHCDAVARQYLDWSIREALTADAETSQVSHTWCLQPTMFAIQVGLAELWKAWGVTPDAVAGHSMGEIAAAYLSGSLDLPSALQVICNRARLQDRADPTGGMLYVALPKKDAAALCEQHPDELWLSAENSPRASTLSGRRPVLETVADDLEQQGVFARLLQVNCACHSPDMEALHDELLTELAGVEGRDATVPMYSTVTGERVDGTSLSTAYWWRNFRQPVLFEPAVRSMLADGIDTFVELSPHPVLVNSLGEILAETATEAVAVSSLSRREDDWTMFLRAVGTLYTSGYELDWHQRYPHGAPALDLPTNPWIHESFWNESATSQAYRAGGQQHPMLKRLDAPTPTWEISWDDHRLSWVHDHNVLGAVLVPGAAYVEAALAAARELTGGQCALEFVEFERACVLGDEPQLSRVELDPTDGTFTVSQRSVRGQGWVRNAYGRFHRSTDSTRAKPSDLDEIRQRCPRRYASVEVYGQMSQHGYAYGPSFCGISQLHVGDGETLARIQPPRVLNRRMQGYLLHPAVLDACFQTAILQPTAERPEALVPFPYLPTGIGAVRVHNEMAAPAWCYTRVRKQDRSGLAAEISVLDEDGQLIAECWPLTGKIVQQSATAPDTVDRDATRFVWQADTNHPGQDYAHTASTLTPSALAAQLEPTQARLTRSLSRHSYATDYQHEMRRLCAAYVARSLHQLHPTLTVGHHVEPADFSGVQAGYEPALTGLLHLLVNEGVLSRHEQGFRVEQPLDEQDPSQLWASMVRRYPSCLAELQLVGTTGPQLHDMLVGETDALEVLFPGGSAEAIEPIYAHSPIARYYNLLVQDAVRQIVATADPRRTLRVLEVGGGTGGLTASVLPVLDPDRCQYTFTDVSEAFLVKARERFGVYDCVDYRTVDLEHDLAEQGITGPYDLVLAADVVHATSDVKKTLLGLQETLAPGGMLTLLEAEPNTPWLDVTFGLTTGWWSFRDLRLRPDGPLLSGPGWTTALESVGFLDVVTIGDPDHHGPGAQNVVVAQAPQHDPVPVPAEGSSQPAGDWIILTGPDDPLGRDLAHRIHTAGGHALVAGDTNTDVDITVRPGHPHDYDHLLAQLAPTGIIQLAPAGPDLDHVDGAVLDHAQTDLIQSTDLAQALDRTGPGGPHPRMYVVTRGVHEFRNPTVRLRGAPLWGLGTVADLERPQARYTMIDLDSAPTASDAESVWAQLSVDDHERAVALRGGERYVRRLVELPPEAASAATEPQSLAADTRLALGMHAPGTLDDLHYCAEQHGPPGPGQVEVTVQAASLNFLDVMTALDQVPPLDSAQDYRFGAECCGTITRVGPDVTHRAVGEDVVIVQAQQGTLASRITVDEQAVVPKPASLTAEEAATLPIVFLTAWYGLHKLARIAPGERVLIHSAAGGTGLAALQIALRAGAQVLATAGTPAKRDLLRSLGVDHVMDSRSLEFAEQVREITGGEGVDVVLNSIAGPTATRSLACLAPYGRFVELGKRDLLQDNSLGLRPFLNNLTYSTFDLRQMLHDRPTEVRTELAALLDRFAAGELHPVPYRVFPAREAEAAFRHLAAAGHIGKVVVTMDEPTLPAEHTATPPVADPRGTWLITGGLGGVGLAMADQLANAGATHLVLVGRSGIATTHAQQRVDNLRARGVQVHTDAVDISTRADLATLLDTVEQTMPPLRGILHCAMVLDDAMLSDLDAERLRGVLEPKMRGAWNLHELTAHRDLDLDAFILFSSATALVGNVGQANYGAANAFLDQLAVARRAQGMPALAAAWGAISDAGYVARHDTIARHVAATGMRSLTAEQAFHALSTLSGGTHPHVGIVPMDWPQFLRHHGLDRTVQPRYEHLITRDQDQSGQAADLTSAGALRQQLRAHTGPARQALLRDGLKTKVASVLGIALDDLDENMRLMDYLDSLLAVELSAWIERELDQKITIMKLMEGPSITQLADTLTDEPATATDG